MKFLTLIFKNIWRHKIRTILTIFGISLGIATIVAFGLITSGMTEIIGDMLKPGKTDLTVAKSGSADIILSFLDNEQVEKIKNTEGVKEIAPYVISIVQYSKNPFFMIFGMAPDKLDLMGIKIIEGQSYANDNEAIIGRITAENKDIKIGDEVEFNKNKYLVTGIYESGISFQDGGAVVNLKQGQVLQGIENQVNVVSVAVDKNYNVNKIADEIEKRDPKVIAIVDIADFDAIDQGNKISQQMSWAISLLAVLIGGVGVMNTIIMSVFERTKEIGVLRAVGWRRSKVLRMIIGESILIGVLAAIIGTAMGIGIILIFMNTELGKTWLVVNYDLIIFIRALGVSIAVVLLGSIYPSLKAARMQPTEALRYE